MGFEFEYERPDRRSDSSRRPRPPRRRRRPGRRRRQAPRFWRRLPRWAKAASAVVLILAVSTIITSRDRSADRSALEPPVASSPPASADTPPAAVSAVTTRPVITRPSTTRPSTTRPSTTRPAPAETRPPPATAAASTAAAAQPPPPPASVAPAPTAPPPEGVDWAELALSVVYIQAEDCPSLPSDMFSSGSGTVVLGGGYVLTNAHVVTDSGQPCRELVVWFTTSFEEEPMDWERADLTAWDSRLDLALLALRRPAPASRSVGVAAQRLAPGEDIRILGYPGAGGLTMTLTRGSYSGMFDHLGETYIKTDADISEGNSGGAAFNEAGVFIGVPTAGIEQVGLLIPAEAAEKFLNRALDE